MLGREDSFGLVAPARLSPHAAVQDPDAFHDASGHTLEQVYGDLGIGVALERSMEKRIRQLWDAVVSSS